MSNRLITINWTPVTDAQVAGYNVYIVHGAPATTTKTLLAYVNDKTSSSYNYTGTEGIQYQFEVRATTNQNNGDESAPIEFFYPNGKALYTPTIITPTGTPQMIVRDTQYLTKDEYIKYPSGLKLTTSSPLYTSGQLDIMLQIASGMVNRFCRRHFDVQTIDEVYDNVPINQYEPKMVTVQVNEMPIQNIIRVDIQVLKYFINFDLSYLQVFQDKGYYQIVPFLGAGTGSGTPLPGSVLTQNILAKVWTRYTFGYDILPPEIKMATSMICTYLIGLQENPVGARSVSLGKVSMSWDTDKNPLWEQVKILLSPYRMNTYRRP